MSFSAMMSLYIPSRHYSGVIVLKKMFLNGGLKVNLYFHIFFYNEIQIIYIKLLNIIKYKFVINKRF